MEKYGYRPYRCEPYWAILIRVEQNEALRIASAHRIVSMKAALVIAVMISIDFIAFRGRRVYNLDSGVDQGETATVERECTHEKVTSAERCLFLATET